MSKRSAVTGGTRFQYHPATLSFALALLGILAIFAAVGCSDDKNVRSASAEALNSLSSQTTPDDTAVHSALALKLSGDDLTSVDSAVKDARTSRNATIPQIANALSSGSGNGRDDTVRIINNVNKAGATPSASASSSPAGSATSTTTTTQSAASGTLTDADLAKIRAVLDDAIKQATQSQNANFAAALTELRKQFDAGTNQAKADVIAKLDSIAKTGSDDIKKAVDEFKKLLNDPNYRVQLPQNVPPTGTPTPRPATTPTPNNNGGQTFTVKCGTFTWGPAGPAPGADSNDSPTQVREAIAAMKVPEASQPFVTIHKMCDGDDTPNGWVIGTSSSEALGVRVSADFLPAGVCLDYDPNVTTIEGEIEHTQRFHDRWSRSFLITDGKLVTSLKTTVYWTPCTFTDGYKVKTTSVVTSGSKSTSTATTGFSCSNLPTKAADLVKVFPGTKESNWMQNPDFKHGLLYIGPEVVTLNSVEGVHHFNYDKNGSPGTTKVGETPPPGSAFTVWFCA